MHQIAALAALVGIAVSAPAPQLINLAAIDAAPDPVLVTAPLDVSENIPSPVATAPLTPITTPGTKRDLLDVQKRDGTCATQPAGDGPTTSPDTATAFTSNPAYDVCTRILSLLPPNLQTQSLTYLA